MFGTNERPFADDEDRILPIEREGLKLMSMGFLLDDGSPAVLRGPMVTRYTQQFLRQVAWAPLDYLFLDLPPGTGDIQLTIVQTVALSGAVIVTTPQEVALIDARKAVAMFHKTNVPVLGLVENMSYFVSPEDHRHYDIFGSGGGEREAARLRVPLLGKVPIDIALRESGDVGRPLAASDPNGPIGVVFKEMADRILQAVEGPWWTRIRNANNVLLVIYVGTSKRKERKMRLTQRRNDSLNDETMNPQRNEGSELVKNSVLYKEFLAEREEILRHKWIESEKAGHDIGFERALLDWIVKYRSAWRDERAKQQSKAA
jgi:MinD-like ATPase involved in chromosome partitioning or flagellar assembly